MDSREATMSTREERVANARAVRAEYALAAAFYANRVEQARAAFRDRAVAEWTDQYRRSVARCRLLGEAIRAEESKARGSDVEVAPTVVALTPESPTDVRSTGLAA
jgi:hypothetical protein